METMGSCSKCRFLASTLLCFYSILESEFPGCENWATTLTLQQAPLGDFSVCCAAGCDLQIEAMRLVVRGFLRAALVWDNGGSRLKGWGTKERSLELRRMRSLWPTSGLSCPRDSLCGGIGGEGAPVTEGPGQYLRHFVRSAGGVPLSCRADKLFQWARTGDQYLCLGR